MVSAQASERVPTHELIYSDAVIESAAASFVRRSFSTTRGRLLILACVINVGGFVLVAVLVKVVA